MPLPPPTERDHLHRRTITLDGYQRADGLIEVEAHLTDTKTYDFPNRLKGTVRAGEPLHDMWLRVAIDDDMMVREAVASTDSAPYPVCPQAAPNFARLVGLKVGAGWRKGIAERVGGVEGCTHLVELLGQIGTVIFQTLYGVRERTRRLSGEPRLENPSRPSILNSCHAYRDDGPIVAQLWPRWAKPAEPASDGGERV